MRGVGKTTVGSHLAALLGATFFDLDTLVLRVLGYRDAREVFSAVGEPVWRAGEASALRRALSSAAPEHKTRVIAVGAGAPCDPVCHALLQESRTQGWRIMHLDAPNAVLVARLTNDLALRPPLTDLPLEAEVRELSARRASAYASLADAVVDAAASPDSVARSVAAALSG